MKNKVVGVLGADLIRSHILSFAATIEMMHLHSLKAFRSSFLRIIYTMRTVLPLRPEDLNGRIQSIL